MERKLDALNIVPAVIHYAKTNTQYTKKPFTARKVHVGVITDGGYIHTFCGNACFNKLHYPEEFNNTVPADYDKHPEITCRSCIKELKRRNLKTTKTIAKDLIVFDRENVIERDFLSQFSGGESSAESRLIRRLTLGDRVLRDIESIGEIEGKIHHYEAKIATLRLEIMDLANDIGRCHGERKWIIQEWNDHSLPPSWCNVSGTVCTDSYNANKLLEILQGRK